MKKIKIKLDDSIEKKLEDIGAKITGQTRFGHDYIRLPSQLGNSNISLVGPEGELAIQIPDMDEMRIGGIRGVVYHAMVIFDPKSPVLLFDVHAQKRTEVKASEAKVLFKKIEIGEVASSLRAVSPKIRENPASVAASLPRKR